MVAARGAPAPKEADMAAITQRSGIIDGPR
jgi:hypothetical protein